MEEREIVFFQTSVVCRKETLWKFWRSRKIKKSDAFEEFEKNSQNNSFFLLQW